MAGEAGEGMKRRGNLEMKGGGCREMRECKGNHLRIQVCKQRRTGLDVGQASKLLQSKINIKYECDLIRKSNPRAQLLFYKV